MKFPLRLIPAETSIDFMGKKFVAFAFSIFISIITVALLLTKGLNLGIDFTGGIVIEVRTNAKHEINEFRDILLDLGYASAVIQDFGKDNHNDILIRLQSKSEDQAKEVEVIKDQLGKGIETDVEFRKVDYVGPKVGNELIWNGIKALLFALLGMLVYVAFRFSIEYGVGAIISLFHNAIATVGFYIISGHEFDLTSIAAILTIIGYSINDTVVIYDRIRENLRKYKMKGVEDLTNLINRSLNEALSRTVMTAATTLLACLALIILAGNVIQGFSMAMFFGIAFGTYCSNFIAAPMLIYTGLGRVKTA